MALGTREQNVKCLVKLNMSFFAEKMSMATGWLPNLLPERPPQKRVVMWSEVTEQRTRINLHSFISETTCTWSL